MARGPGYCQAGASGCVPGGLRVQVSAGTVCGTLTRESVGEKERNVLRVAGTVAVHWERAVCRLYRLAQRAHGHSQYCQLRRREGAFADVQTRAQRGSTSCGGCKLIRVGDGGSQQMDEGSHGARRRRRRIATLAL